MDMIVLGIDPGLGTTGWALVAGDGTRSSLCGSGAIRTSSKCDSAERLLTICDGIRGLLSENDVDEVAIEDVFLAKDARAALALGQARGAAILGAAMMGVRVCSYSALEVKQSVTGNGRASKEQVSYMVQSLLGLAEPLRPTDSADAAAIAICHIGRVAANRLKTESLVE
jgi:crossover junction endodeoxyribonuclease RuvC